MLGQAGGSPSIEAVERQIASGFHRLRFAAPIEAMFAAAGMPERRRALIAANIAAIVLYDLFVVADWFVLHDMVAVMAVARFGVFTPAILAVIAVLRRARTDPMLDRAATVAPCLAILLPMVALVFSQSPDRLAYQYTCVLIMLFAMVVQQIRFRYALGALAVMLGIQLTTTYVSRAFSPETYATLALFFVTAAILLALTAYRLERTERRSFLLSLRADLLRAEVERGARTDALTGLFNRRHLADATAALWAEARGAPRVVSAILLDIDHFKAFNDSQGHLAGDGCLRAVSARVAAVAAAHEGLAFRFGGEEMLLLLPGIDAAAAARAAEAIRAAIQAAAIPHPAVGAVVTASLGVAGTLAPEATVETLIAAADTALYAAKRAGRNQVWPAVVPPMPSMAAEAAEAA